MNESSVMREEIAIIGIAGRFPGAQNVEQFWRNLCNGIESVSFFTEEELATAGVDPAVLKDPRYVRAGAVLTDADCFDAAFFGMNPREAEITDPQHRVLLECSWEALENSGYDPESYKGAIGVFAGVGPNTYFHNNLAHHRDLLEVIGPYQAMIGNEGHFPATRVSYKLNLRGPSINVQTACSTSGVAIHLACQSLLGGECDMALAGGARIRVPLRGGYLYVEDGIPSPDGHCRVFDAKARGTVYGSGAAIVVLKRLSEAIRDRDSIYAVIKSSAVNNDGAAKVGFTAPSVKGQAAVIGEALALAEISADTVGYVEAHGTGTTLGDPIEIAALTKAFRESTARTGFCAIASVKTNVGHLDAAAGATGVIKAALVLKHGKIPPSLHFEQPNPEIDFRNSPFYVNTRLTEWKTGSGPRRAGASSFGLGGTNAHLVLEEPPATEPSGPSRPAQLLVLSAKTSTALEQATTNLRRHLQEHPGGNLADVGYTLQTGRRRFSHRRALVCTDVKDAVTILEASRSKHMITEQSDRQEASVAFMFPGQGAQYVNMGISLYREEPIFRRTVDECAELLRPCLDADIRRVLYPEPSEVAVAEHKITETFMTQPALFVIEYALAQVWMEWGIQPHSLIGHSLGEYVAACLAGVMSRDDALLLVAKRAQLMQKLPSGAMLAILLPADQLEPLLVPGVSVAAVNAPSLTVVSGQHEAIAALEERLADRGVELRQIRTSHAFHSEMMDPVLKPFTELVSKVKLNSPRLPWVSSLSGDWITPAQAIDPSYWVQQLRRPVCFAEGLQKLLGSSATALLEVGPGTTLSALVKQQRAKLAQRAVLTSLHYSQQSSREMESMFHSLAGLWVTGAQVDWRRVHGGTRRRRVSLPTYPFERKRYWIDPPKAVDASLAATMAIEPAPNGGSRSAGQDTESTEREHKEESMTERATQISQNKRKSRIRQTLNGIIHELSGIDAATDGSATFVEMGFDSLLLTRANVEFQKKFGVKITFRQLFEEAPSPDALAEYIDQQLPADAFPEPAAPPEPSPAKRGIDAPPSLPLVSSRKERVVEMLKSIIHDLSGIDSTAIDSSATFVEMGFDSLLLTRANVEFQKKFGVKITFRQLFEEAPSPDALAEYIDRQLPSKAFSEPIAPPLGVAQAVSRIALETPVTAPQPLPPAGSNDSSETGGLLERVISMQMQLMSEQLRAVQTGGEPQIIPSRVPPHNPSEPPRLSTSPTNLGTVTPSVGGQSTVTKPGDGSSQTRDFGPFRPVKKSSGGELTPRQRASLDALITRIVHRTKESKRLAQLHRRHLADPRTVAGFRSAWKELVYPIVTTRSSGCRLWDVDGNEYVDLTMGFGVNLLGHSLPFVTESLQEQLKKGIEIGPQSALAGEVAKLICEFTGMERAAFCNTGSEAVLAAIRMARTVTGRDKIAVFAGDYHGIFDEVLVRGIDLNGRRRSVPVAPGIPHRMVEDVLILDYGDFKSLDVLRAQAGDIAAVLVEPVQARNPVLEPREFLNALRETTRALGIALVFDEVITGFRIHPGGAQAWFGVEADIATYGKGIGGGVPIAVVAGRAAYMDALDGGMWNYGDTSIPEAGVTYFAGTFVRHPLALAAARSVLNYMQDCGPGLQERLNEMSARLAAKLTEVFRQCHAPIRLDRFASIFHLHFEGDQEFTELLFYHLRDRGVHISNRPWYLSTAHKDEDLDWIVRAFKESVKEMQDGGFLPEAPAPSPNGREPTSQSGPPGSRLPSSRLSESPPGGGLAPQSAATQDADGTQPIVRETPITESQMEIWLASAMSEEASCSFNLGYKVNLKGRFKPAAMQQALQQLVDRHESFRTTFSASGESIRISRSVQLEVPVLDFTELDQEERHARVEELLRRENETPFDFTTGPLVRAQIIKLEEEHHLLVFTVHHVICDGFSIRRVIRDLTELYSAACKGIVARLPAPMQYSNYATWQLEQQKTPEFAAAEAYWLARFSEPAPVLELPTDRPKPRVRTYGCGEVAVILDKVVVAGLKRLGARHGCTMWSVLLSAINLLLYRLSGQTDIVIGTPAVGQMIAGNEDLVGHCVNMQPFRSQIRAELMFPEYLKSIRGLVLDAKDHENYTFGSLLKKLKVRREAGRFPILSIQFNLEEEKTPPQFYLLNADITATQRRSYTLDLGFNLAESNGQIELKCWFNTDLYKTETIQRWMGHFQTLLKEIVAKPEQRLADLSLLTESEKRQVLVDWNDTRTPYPQDKCVHELFEAQVQRKPDARAVVFQDQQLSYRDLNRRANQLAHSLRRLGVGPEVRVGICTEPSLDTPVALLGVLKAGGVYVPLDPEHPRERLAFVLEDAGISVLLTEKRLLERLPPHKATVVDLDDIAEKAGRESQNNPPLVATPQNLAYVIYTSGSTGSPKGVMVPHQAVVNRLHWSQATYPLNSHDRVLQQASVTFDFSLWEFFGPLLCGAQVVLGSGERQDPAAIVQLIDKHKITTVHFVPAMLELVLEQPGIKRCDSLRRVFCGGEALPSTLQKAFSACLDAELYNQYGPTETTIDVAFWHCKRDIDSRTVPIGRPIANTQIYILDDRLQPVPIGVAGEIHIGGVALARGYIGRPDLTAEKFIPNLFSAAPGGRLYRTGDIGRFLPDGNVDFIGRNDDQVKIRGFRIELGEIESTLRRHAAVRDAILSAREDTPGEKRLVAYVAATEDSSVSIPELRAFLKEKLPEYMQPSAFVVMQKLPRTTAGKADRTSLPAPDQSRPELKDFFVAPSTLEQKTIAEIWAQILHVDRIGIHDNFFDLGGHSLLATRVVSRLREAFSIELPLRNLFEWPTVSGLADCVRTARGSGAENPVKIGAISRQLQRVKAPD